MLIARSGVLCSEETEGQQVTAVSITQLEKTNRKSLSRVRSLLKTSFESLNQLFQNKCGEWLQWNFCYWDEVERGPRSELSSYWARQTAACPGGGGHGEGGTPLSSTHSPSPHPAVPLHLRPHPLTPPVFYVHFDFLPPVVIQAEEGGVPSWRTQNC